MSSEKSFEQSARDLESLESVVAAWADHQRSTVQALRTSVEELNAEALRRLIRVVKAEPGGLEALTKALDDPWVRGVLHYHGMIRDPKPRLWDQVQAALNTVRPALDSHNGDVELLAVEPPEIRIRMLGGCNGCAFTDATVKLGIEKAVCEHVPEIERVVVVEGSAADAASEANRNTAESPFSKPWIDAGPADEVRGGQITVVELEKVSLLLTRVGDSEIRAYPNACTHLGMPLDTGELSQGILTCRYHGFQYILATGECITAPEVQLPRYPVRVQDGRVQIQLIP
ncbi:MAG: NifU family protein [Myxococcota bacterium]|nr:NifU family protein [Myxococcota bacterium]